MPDKGQDPQDMTAMFNEAAWKKVMDDLPDSKAAKAQLLEPSDKAELLDAHTTKNKSRFSALLNKAIRGAQDISISAVKNIPEPIKRPIRQATGRVLSNIIEPLGYEGAESGNANKAQEMAKLFSRQNIGHTLASIARDQPAYPAEDPANRMPYADAALRAGRPLLREYFDLPPQDTENMYIRQGKNYRINPATTNPVALDQLQEYKKGALSPDKFHYGYLGGAFKPGYPDPWNFDLSPKEVEEAKGRPYNVQEFGRSMMEAVGNPAVLQTGGYAQGGVVAAPSGSSVGLDMQAPMPMAPAAPDPYTNNVMNYADKVRAALDQQSAPPQAAVPTGPVPGAPPANPSQDNMTINARSGEFIFPEPVTKYYGVKKLEDMVQKALEDIKPPGNPAPPPMPEAQSFARGGLVGRKHFLRHVAAPHPSRRVKPVKVSNTPLNAMPLPPMPAGPEAAPQDMQQMQQPQGYAYGGVVKPYGGGNAYAAPLPKYAGPGIGSDPSVAPRLGGPWPGYRPIPSPAIGRDPVIWTPPNQNLYWQHLKNMQNIQSGTRARYRPGVGQLPLGVPPSIPGNNPEARRPYFPLRALHAPGIGID